MLNFVYFLFFSSSGALGAARATEGIDFMKPFRPKFMDLTSFGYFLVCSHDFQWI
jgi:hypothetical protein